jgi:hypothetical protein
LGWIVSFGIRGEELESADWDEENGIYEDEDEDNSDNDDSAER